MIEKPPYGAPCNGCGTCCRFEVCLLGQRVLNVSAPGPCPAIVTTASRKSECGLIVSPEVYFPDQWLEHGTETVSKAAAMLNGAGFGCDCSNENDYDHAENMRMMAQAPKLDAGWAFKVLGL